MPGESSASRTSRAVLWAAVVTITGIFGSRLLGLVRVMVQSSAFGAENAGILRAAFDIPDLLFYIVAGGALRSGFVPIFTELLTLGRDDPAKRAQAWKLFSTLVSLVALASAGLVLLGCLGARPLAQLVSGGWSDRGFSEDSIEQVIWLTRILLPAQIFLLVGGVFSGTLDSLKRFSVTAAVPNFYNLCIIGAMLWLGERHGIASAAYGTVCGALLGHLVWQAWALWRTRAESGCSYRPSLNLGDPTVRRVIRIAAPIVLGLCVAEINLKVSTWVMAIFGEAARNHFDNASRVARLPDGIFGAGFGIALFPFLSEMAALGKTGEFRRQAEQILRLATICTLPSVALFCAAAAPLIDLLFGRGRFTPTDVQACAQLLPLFALGIVPITLQVVLTRAFYAQQDSRTPVKVGAAAVLLGVVANVALARVLDRYGPPLALALTSTANVAGLLWLFGRRFGYDDAPRLWSVLWRGALAAVGAGLATWGGLQALELGRAAATALATVVCLGTYAVLLHLLRVPELREALALLRRRGRRGSAPTK
ncbi:MAG: murein biosynthesis integral membrane protein MurJ [Fimbriimonadaceae bacterium]|nr:murein biosynthesis integral membrane protein MurJ [Fimbriimonadaceae bacterium]